MIGTSLPTWMRDWPPLRATTRGVDRMLTLLFEAKALNAALRSMPVKSRLKPVPPSSSPGLGPPVPPVSVPSEPDSVKKKFSPARVWSFRVTSATVTSISTCLAGTSRVVSRVRSWA